MQTEKSLTTTKPSGLTQHGELSQPSINKIAQATGSKGLTVQLIQAGRNAPIRDLSEYDYKTAGTVAILSVARDYCGADLDTNDSTINECREWLLKMYPGLSITEIKTAFELSAAGELPGNDRINLTAYKGVFSVDIFSQTIRSYEVYRNRIIAAIEEENKKALAEKEEEKNMLKKKVFEQDVIARFMKLKKSGNTEFKTTESVPWEWGATLLEAGLIFTDAKLWTSAKVSAVDNFIRQQESKDQDPFYREAMNHGMTRTDRDRIYKEVKNDAGHFPGELRTSAIRIYYQMLILKEIGDYVCNN